MTICPIALAVGCEKCPAFKFCPLTTVLGDQEKRENGSSRRADLYNQIEKEKARTDDDKYQKYAEEELEKNTKQMESFKGEDAEVIPERNKMKKEESGKE